MLLFNRDILNKAYQNWSEELEIVTCASQTTIHKISISLALSMPAFQNILKICKFTK